MSIIFIELHQYVNLMNDFIGKVELIVGVIFHEIFFMGFASDNQISMQLTTGDLVDEITVFETMENVYNMVSILKF